MKEITNLQKFKEKLIQDGIFLFKVVRNGLILSGLYFFSVWVSSDLTLASMKPMFIFLGTYILSELARYYGLAKTKFPTSKKANIKINPFIY